MKRISDEELDKLVQIFANKMDEANTLFLKEIGSLIKQIKKMNPTQAHQLIQMLRYGTNYETIVKKMSKYTKISEKDIKKVFKEYAKKDQLFYKQFYKYRNVPFIPYEKNEILRRQTEALANLTNMELSNFTRSRAIGFMITDSDGVVKFTGLRETYEKLLDTAMINVGQGKETFDTAMRKILKDIGTSGLKYLDYESGRSIRLDSMVRMHLKSGLRELHNENQKLFGDEFNSDGVEISVHEYPAEDHEDAQGRQFSNEEFDKLQNTGVATDYKGNSINIHAHLKNGLSDSFRPISEYNCYHYIFAIVLGVSNTEYTEEQLQAIKDRNQEGFEFEGKHYTMYQGTQLQRQIERKVREQKDLQILGRESEDDTMVLESQTKITQLTNKYKELCNASGLPSKVQRMQVSGYRRKKV